MLHTTSMKKNEATYKKSYYDAYKRARGVTYDDLKQQKLLTDRGAYMTFLEEKVTRLTASLLTVQGFDERIESFQTQMNLMEDKILNINRTVRRNTRDINGTGATGGFNTSHAVGSSSMHNKSKSSGLLNKSIVDQQISSQELCERVETMEDMYLKVEKAVVNINSTLAQQGNVNNDTAKKLEETQRNMEEHIIRMEEQWGLKFDTYKKQLQRIADDNVRLLKQTMLEYKNDLKKQNKMELEKYKYDIIAKQNDLFDQIRIQLDERNDQYVEDRVRFYNDKMQEISMEQNNQFNKHVEFMDKKITNFYEKLEQDRKSEHNKHMLMVNREQATWKKEVNETQLKLKQYINAAIDENKHENQRIWNEQHEKINVLINNTSNHFSKQLNETLNKTKDIIEKERTMIQTEHQHVKKDLSNQTHLYETKLLTHENKLESHLDETKQMYKDMQGLMNNLQEQTNASNNKCINDLNQIKLSVERKFTQNVIDIKKHTKELMGQQLLQMKQKNDQLYEEVTQEQMSNLNELEQKMEHSFDTTNKTFNKYFEESKHDFNKLLKKEMNNTTAAVFKEIEQWKHNTLSSQLDNIYKHIDDLNTQQKNDMESNVKTPLIVGTYTTCL
jgi:hypothetical protein